ncbi:aspartate-semialdehyde dehydrogenase [Ancylomarina salipaludis]|uniref:Aspartate-semialdehyde dehydrogenase n=1 Tax=Ancylomarina salipaludis TaxID=2501299 RepID=A0A4Q1JNQ3_9BACT|nr:aspartate-semialdehyde dehydrogenase [Ancylomarina salipaludis]RXQ96515.1 aspartate-semialdehyde dehydrogenase [Ancylomarina salipaludis]
MKIAVVGATGLVGQKILEVLTERNFPVDELYPVASERSKGKKIEFRGKQVTVIGMKEAIELKPHIAIFSAGGNTSLEWAPEFEKVGTFVVDNSSAWRMHPEKKLIVPEINASELTVNDKIIANPNCSTIQMVVALAPLHKKYGIKRLIISTYQSISGTGVKAVKQLENERAGVDGEMAYPYPIDKNCLPHCDVFEENAYTKEEMKLINETRKILCDDSIRITATAVRVPVVGGHSESVNIEFEKDFDLDELRAILAQSEGIILQDEPKKNIYPMPRFAHEKNEVFVGRIRRDFSNPNSLNMWIVADNLRKGAATNAIQIAEYLTQSGIVK